MLTRKTVVETALTWLGTPWFSNQSTKQIGCDCVGFLAGVGKETGFLPSDYFLENHARFDRNRLLEKELDQLFDPSTSLESANIILLGRMNLLTHVGIVINNKEFIHASDTKRIGVKISSLSYHVRFIQKIYQIPGIS